MYRVLLISLDKSALKQIKQNLIRFSWSQKGMQLKIYSVDKCEIAMNIIRKQQLHIAVIDRAISGDSKALIESIARKKGGTFIKKMQKELPESSSPAKVDVARNSQMICELLGGIKRVEEIGHG